MASQRRCLLGLTFCFRLSRRAGNQDGLRRSGVRVVKGLFPVLLESRVGLAFPRLLSLNIRIVPVDKHRDFDRTTLGPMRKSFPSKTGLS